MKRLILIAALLLPMAPVMAEEQRQAKSLDELLEMVRDRTLQDKSELRKREREFDQARDRQRDLLAQARKRRDDAEALSAKLEATYAENETAIDNKEQQLRDRLGALKELFGILQQQSGDLRGVVESSPTSAQYPDRGVFLEDFAKKMGRSSQISTIEEIERLWFELQREMTETGKIVKFSAPVLLAEGRQEEMDVIRVGSFNVIRADDTGRYLVWRDETQQLAELKRQPDSAHLDRAADFAEGGDPVAGFSLDPTGGSLLARLVQSPDLRERIAQGGLVGYIILALGAFALLLALERIFVLTRLSRRIDNQLKDIDNPDERNPLGRVLKVYFENRGVDSETLEMKLGKAILREMPSIERWLSLLKIIAVMAPLLGLLGTVTGMINTFQAITLFGTGDPKTMAGGISQALVTTVLGLCVAIPTVFLHSIANGRARSVTHTLTEQSAGLVAEAMERNRKAA